MENASRDDVNAFLAGPEFLANLNDVRTNVRNMANVAMVSVYVGRDGKERTAR